MADTDAVCESELRIATPHRELLDQVLDKWSVSYTHLTLPTKRIV